MTPVSFIHDLALGDVPAPVVARAKLLLLDLAGVAVSGAATDLSRIVRDHAARHMGAGEGGVRILLDGRRTSPAGAAFAGASTIDAFDAHDGHALTKGHAGVAILPALLAVAEATNLGDGRAFLAALVAGYEVATRAGIALHASVLDYHTSGAWNALGCAAVAARYLGLDAERTRHALGIAEYHGPRSQMMRCIAHPTMVKDGSGWGAHAGVTAAYLAESGFTGAPAVTVEAQAEHWDDLGTRWRLLEQYVKPHPVCRWAQPAIEAAAALAAHHALDPDRIASVEIRTFAHAVALGTAMPRTTEEAQYALGFPVACALARGRIGGAEIGPAGLGDPAVRDLLARIAVVEEPAFSARFPAERLASLVLTLADGTALASPPTTARGDPDSFLAESELRAKFDAFAAALPRHRRDALVRAVETLDQAGGGVAPLAELLTAPLPPAGDRR